MFVYLFKVDELLFYLFYYGRCRPCIMLFVDYLCRPKGGMTSGRLNAFPSHQKEIYLP